MKLKEFQEVKVDELVDKSLRLLDKSGSRKILFQAPTGSGKTIMMAEFLSSISAKTAQSDYGISVIWTAPRNLHLQSKSKLTNYFSVSNSMKCREFYELNNLYIDNNEILFLNWESINKEDKNLIMKRNERNFYLDKLIQNTKERNNKIILVIDESHYQSTSEISQKIITDMGPDLTIEVSATPATINGIDDMVKVDREEVIEAGMIKKSLVLNEGFKNDIKNNQIVTELCNAQDEQLIDRAMKKRKELERKFSALGAEINPLVLIQLPDKKVNDEERLMSQIESYLEKAYEVSRSNGKLAVYLSDDKTNLTNVEKGSSKVEVLIFKQAIALGWDCPRSQILVLFRESKSLTFSIQTMGRIMRMPQQTHYSDEALNSAYVFTNISEISISDDFGRDYISLFTSTRKSIYTELKLKSVYSVRQRERTRLNPDFTKIFIEQAKLYNLISKINLNASNVSVKHISESIQEGLDDFRDRKFEGNIEVELINPDDIQSLFNGWVSNSLTLFFPENRTIDRIKHSIYSFFQSETDLRLETEQILINGIVLDSQNSGFFRNVIHISEMIYKDKFTDSTNKLADVAWEIPEQLSIGGDAREISTEKSIMQPFYLHGNYQSEINFISFLDKNEKVDWWFKNGERDATFFAIKYSDIEGDKPFYVDFLVKTTSGVLWIIDTKRGFTIELGKDKSDGLQSYLKLVPNARGGFVDNTDKEYKGIWKVFRKPSDELNSKDFSNWDELILE